MTDVDVKGDTLAVGDLGRVVKKVDVKKVDVKRVRGGKKEEAWLGFRSWVQNRAFGPQRSGRSDKLRGYQTFP